MPVRVLVAEENQRLREQMRDYLSNECSCEVVGLARDGHEAIQLAMQLLPHIMFISHDLPGITGLQTCEIINALAPDIMAIMVTDTKSIERVEAAMKVGARAVVTRPLKSPEVGYLIQELADVRNRRDSDDIQELKDPARFPKVISITGAKGGVGKSTIAVNLAVALAKQAPNKVVIVDMYTQFGDIATMFNVTPKHTISDLEPILKDLDQDLIRNYVSEHESGVHVLVATINPLPLDAISVECWDTLIHLLKRTYRYVIIDMPPILHPTTIHVLMHSNIVLLIANLFDLTTAMDTKKFYDALDQERISKEHIKVVLNRVSKVNRLHAADLEQMFPCGILAHIPNESKLVNAINKGVPLAMTDGDSPYGRSIDRLAATILGVEGNLPFAVNEAERWSLLPKARKGR